MVEFVTTASESMPGSWSRFLCHPLNSMGSPMAPDATASLTATCCGS